MLSLHLLTLTLLPLVLSAPPIPLEVDQDSKEGDDSAVNIPGNLHGGHLYNNEELNVRGNINNGLVDQGAQGSLGVGGDLNNGKFNLRANSKTNVKGDINNAVINIENADHPEGDDYAGLSSCNEEGDESAVNIPGNLQGGHLYNNEKLNVHGNINNGLVHQGAQGSLGVGGDLNHGKFNLRANSKTNVKGDINNAVINLENADRPEGDDYADIIPRWTGGRLNNNGKANTYVGILRGGIPLDDYKLIVHGNVNGGMLKNNADVHVGGSMNDAYVDNFGQGNINVVDDLNGGQFNLHGNSQTKVGGNANLAIINKGNADPCGDPNFTPCKK